MKTGRKRFLWMVFLVLVIPLLLLKANARAAQIYHGDGATYNGSGGWTTAVAPAGTCLSCHIQGNAVGAPDKSAYLTTGHKNMLRKVSPGEPWAGADGTVYGSTDPYGSGSIIDWAAGMIDVGGTGTDIRPLYYIFGGWIDPNRLNTIFEGGFTGELSPSGSYGCARCHTTGYQFDASAQAAGYEPRTYDGTAITDDQLSRIPSDYTSGTSSWYLDGIQCERCHNADDGINNHTASGAIAGGIPTVSTLEASTGLCIECHRQESVDTSLNTITPGITSGTELTVSNDDPAVYAPYFEYSAGQTFLNSPHARFTGTVAQTIQNSSDLSVTITGSYDSKFQDSTSGQNLGCAGCHDVHQSTVAAVGAAAPFYRTCSGCHEAGGSSDPNAPQVKPAYINHLGGTGTPLENVATDASAPCIICHMTSAYYHLVRINVDAGYSTFPSLTQLNSGTTAPDTSPDGTFSNAVWIDVDLACGQCHGGSAGDGATKNGAPYYSKAELSALAADMHNTEPTAKFTWTNDGSVSYKVNFNAISSICPPGVNSCSYSWDFGDTQTTNPADNTATGVAVSHTYTAAQGAAVVTLTVSTDGGTSDITAQTVTPAAIHAPPDCGITSLDVTHVGTTTTTQSYTTFPAAAQVGDMVEFVDGSSIPPENGSTATVLYLNWGDGSPLSTGTVGGATPASVGHKYIWPGNYTMTQTVQDAMGFNCTQKYYIAVSSQDVTPATGTLTIDASGSGSAWTTNSECTGLNTPAKCCTGAGTGTCDFAPNVVDPPMSYYVYGTNIFGNKVTRASGTVALGAASFDVNPKLAPDTYDIVFYYPTGHSCDYTTNPIVTTAGKVAVPGTVTITNCH